ncbi:hypothetical protein ABK040_015436 [Willaertia magna]
MVEITLKPTGENAQLSISNKTINQTTEAIKSLGQGELPSNEQIVQGIESTKEAIQSLELEKSSSGQQLQDRAAKLLDLLKQLILEKNEDESLQNFLKHFNNFIKKFGEEVSENVKEDVQKEWNEQTSSTIVTKNAKDDFYVAVQGLKNFTFQIIRSNDFRLVMLDCFEYLQQLLKSNLRSAEIKGTELINQTAETLIGEKPKDNLAGEGEAHVPGPSKEVKSAWDKPLLSTLKVEEQGGTKIVTNRPEVVVASEEKLQQSINEEQEKQVQLSEQEMNQIVDKLVDRLDSIVNSLHSNPNYRRAVFGFFNLFDQFKQFFVEHLEHQKEDLSSTLRNDEDFNGMIDDLQTLLVNWTNDKDIVNDLKKSLKDIYNAFQKDKELNKLLSDSQKDIRRFIDNPALMKDDSEKQKIKDRVRRFREKAKEKSEMEPINRFTDVCSRIVNELKKDELTQELSEQSRQLISDLFLDKYGNFQIKTDTLDQLRIMVLNYLRENINKLTDIEINYKDESIEYNLSGIKLVAKDILPSQIRMTGRSVANLNYSDEELAENLTRIKSILVFHLSGIQLNFYDVNFSFQRFSFPAISDRGKMDVDTGDLGISIHLRIGVDTSQNHLFFNEGLNVDIDDVNITFKEAENHQFLLSFLSPILGNMLRRRLKFALSSFMQSNYDDFFDRLNLLIDQAKKQSGNLTEKVTQTYNQIME